MLCISLYSSLHCLPVLPKLSGECLADAGAIELELSSRSHQTH